MRLAIVCLVLFFITPTWAATYNRTSPNLLPDTTVRSSKGWHLKNAVHKRNISRRSDGSGSMQLNKNALVLAPSVDVKPGQVYTCGLYFRGNATPTTFMRLGLQVNNSRGKFPRNAKSASHWGYAKAKRWEEAVIIFRAQPGDGQIRMLITRTNKSPNTGSPMWIDHVYCGKDISFDQSKSAKTAFNGGLVKVDAQGHVSIKQQGQFKREFLRCMFADQKRGDWFLYGANGFNCNIWAASLRQLKKGVQAGLPFSFFELAPYVKGWAAGNLTQLRKQIQAILNSPYADNLVGYYYDNESHQQFQLATKVLKLVDELDRKNGKRQRPIYVLQGSYGSHAPYIPYVDMVGTYTIGGNTAGAGGGAWGLVTLEHLHGQTSPVVFAQINQGVGNSLQERLLLAIRQGAKAMGFWRNKSIETRPWWRDFPRIVQKALDALGMEGTENSPAPAPTPTKGSIRVSIRPQDAVQAGAKWRLSNEDTWLNSGQTRSDLPFGTYTILFKSIDKWITPPNQQISISANNPDRSTNSGDYVREKEENNNPPPVETGSNLLPNANVSSRRHWYLKNASYTSNISRQEDGSGAIQLKKNPLVLAPKLKVQPGKTYTCSLHFMTDSSKKTFLRLGLQVNNAKGRFLYNSRSAKNWRAGSKRKWGKASIVHKAKSGDGIVRMLISIPKVSDKRANIWVDDVNCSQQNAHSTMAITHSTHGTTGQSDAHRHDEPLHTPADISGTLPGHLIGADPFVFEWVSSPAFFIYDDEIDENWSIDIVSDVIVEVADMDERQGDRDLVVEYLEANAALHFVANEGFFTDGYHALSLAIRGDFEDDHTLRLHVYTADRSSPIGSVDLRDYLDSEDVTDQWQEAVIPMADLKAEKAKVTDVIIESSGAQEIQLNALRFQ